MGQDAHCNNLSTKSECNVHVVSVELIRSYPGVESFELCSISRSSSTFVLKEGYIHFLLNIVFSVWYILNPVGRVAQSV